MVRFLQYWIQRSMEDPAEREEKTRKHLEMVQKGADEIRERWAQPVLPPGYWNQTKATTPTKYRLAEAEAESISPYARALADMEANAKKKGKD